MSSMAREACSFFPGVTGQALFWICSSLLGMESTFLFNAGYPVDRIVIHRVNPFLFVAGLTRLKTLVAGGTVLSAGFKLLGVQKAVVLWVNFQREVFLGMATSTDRGRVLRSDGGVSIMAHQAGGFISLRIFCMEGSPTRGMVGLEARLFQVMTCGAPIRRLLAIMTGCTRGHGGKLWGFLGLVAGQARRLLMFLMRKGVDPERERGGGRITLSCLMTV